MTKSNWTLTLDPAGTPVVILTAGDRLDAELQWNAERLVDVVPLVRATAPTLRNQGNASVRISFSRFVDSATDAASRKELLQSLLTALSADPKPLRVNVAGVTDRYWQFSAALVTAYSPEKYMASPFPRRIQTYDIIATGLAEVAVP